MVKRLVAKSNFNLFKIFSEDLTAVHMTKPLVLLNKVIYVGMSILDISKIFMYKFLYQHIKQLYESKAILLMTDTDSLLYVIEMEDFCSDEMKDMDLYDTSDYSKNHLAYSDKNKKELGKFKDEMVARIIKQFVGLKPKLYSVLEKEGGEKKTAKGINRAVIKKTRHVEYLRSLMSESSEIMEMNEIRSCNHTLESIIDRKTGLSPYDDKRYLLDDKITTLAHGHYCIGFDL